VVACAGDSIVPAVWAYCQDVGGDQAAVALGWSNMWGNLGVPVVAQIIPFMLTTKAHFGDWREVFWMCAGGFVLLGLCSLFLDSNRRLVEESNAPQPLIV
jgi:nitrate/nitrite transporter NarK